MRCAQKTIENVNCMSEDGLSQEKKINESSAQSYNLGSSKMKNDCRWQENI